MDPAGDAMSFAPLSRLHIRRSSTCGDQEVDVAISFPNESAQYRTARNRLLEQEIALRRTMEALAAARRELPPGGPVAEDYLFDGLSPDGSLTKISFSELFESGNSSLVIY